MSTPQVGKYLPDEEITPENAGQIKDKIHEDFTIAGVRSKSIFSTAIKDGAIEADVKNPALPSGAYPDQVAFETAAQKSVSKNLKETKDLLTNFHKKMAEYPKHLSYEGSMVLCVLLAMKPVASVNIGNIPMVDQTLIREMLVSKTGVEPSEFIGTFDVKFDNNKDFTLIFNPQNHSDIILQLFNTVAHPRPTDLKESTDVPVENQGEKIAVGGGKILLNKRTSQRLAGIEPTSHQYSEEKEYAPSPQLKMGRNAYEIRADVLQMAIHWSQTEDGIGQYKKPSDDAVVALAKKFYAFVENKR